MCCFHGALNILSLIPCSFNLFRTATATYGAGGIVQSGVIPYGTQVLNLVPADDSAVLANQTVVCLSGLTLQGQSFYYDGVAWITSQQKIETKLKNNYVHLTIHFKDAIAYKYFCELTPLMEERAVVKFGERKPVLKWRCWFQILLVNQQAQFHPPYLA